MSHVITRPNNNTRNQNRASRPLQVAEAIKNFVVSEALQPGDKLPNEAELIKRFSMAKGTIREAMRILEAQGLVKTRTGPGGGCFVHEVSENRTRALLSNYFYFKHLSITDIYQIRKKLEPELVSNLAGKLTIENIEELENLSLGKYDYLLPKELILKGLLLGFFDTEHTLHFLNEIIK